MNISSKGRSLLLFSIIFWSLQAHAIGPLPVDPKSVVDQMCFREAVVGWSEHYLGVRYVYGGKRPESGLDCSGFTRFILQEFGIDLEHSSSMQSKQGVHVPLNEVMPGDLMFFGWKGRIQHVGLVVKRTEEGIFCAHASSSRGTVVENMTKSSYWRPRILFARDVISGFNNVPDIRIAVTREPVEVPAYEVICLSSYPITFVCNDLSPSFQLGSSPRPHHPAHRGMFDLQ
jgi:hypothetical protein